MVCTLFRRIQEHQPRSNCGIDDKKMKLFYQQTAYSISLNGRKMFRRGQNYRKYHANFPNLVQDHFTGIGFSKSAFISAGNWKTRPSLSQKYRNEADGFRAFPSAQNA